MTIEQKLSNVLCEFARTLFTDYPIQAILDHLVVEIVAMLPVDGAGVTLIAPGAGPRYIAASDDAALRYERLQTELGEGPCVVAHATGEAVVVADLRDDHRFERFAPRAVSEGLRAVFTFPLHREGDRLGALDLYRTTPGPLDDDAMSAAQTLAEVAAAYLLNAASREELHESSALARHVSLHDALTGLPNRTLLVQLLDHAILRSERSDKLVAILFADLDRFKAINDSFGHRVGDELLVAVAERLASTLRRDDTVARLAGDEFVILCEDLDDAKEAELLASRVCLALREPFALSGTEVHVSASVGVAFAGKGDDVPERVLHDADVAMYRAKREGGGRHATLDLAEFSAASGRVNLNRDLRGALDRNELEAAYQPIVDAEAGVVLGAEALLRWNHPLQGMVGPEVVVPLAEHGGLIHEIGRWVLERACRDRNRWMGGGPAPGLRISVNVSAHQLMAADFASMVEKILSDTSTEPGMVTLEVTESVFVHDPERVLQVLHELKRIGVSLALDDFGTGYSSLSYLRQFPVDVVKIDRVFVADLENDHPSRLIVGAVVGLAHGLGMSVVAEGIETAEQHRRVANLGCDTCQGFYFAHPMSSDAIETLLADGGVLHALR